MREMKDSGTKWLGIVPQNWEVDKLKFHLMRNEPRNPGNKIVLSLYREWGIVPKDSRDDNYNVTSEDTTKYKYVRPGDFVINKMKAWQGSVAVSDYEGIVSPAYFIYNFTDNLYHKRYFHYLLRSCYKDEFMRMSGGIRVGQWDLPSEALDNTIVLLPPLSEQQSIASFLDAKCAEIDALTADIQSQIDTLEQYKRSVITETVTKGLNPDVGMKDSGIEWIGEIPEHWKSVQIKHLYTLVSGATPSPNAENWDGDVLWITPADYKTNDKYVSCGKRNLTKQGYNSCSTSLIPIGSIVFSKRAPIGTVAINTAELCTNQGCLSCISKTDTINDFYYYVMSVATEHFELLGSGTTFKEISANSFANCKLPYPPVAEQQQIATYLDTKCAEIDGIIADKKQQLEILAEYKKSLIYEYVTGKKEVPDA